MLLYHSWSTPLPSLHIYLKPTFFIFNVLIKIFIFVGWFCYCRFIFKINCNQNYSHSNIQNKQSTNLQNCKTHPSLLTHSLTENCAPASKLIKESEKHNYFKKGTFVFKFYVYSMVDNIDRGAYQHCRPFCFWIFWNLPIVESGFNLRVSIYAC